MLDRTPRPGHPFRGYDLEIFAIRASAASRSEVPPLFRRRGTGRAGLEIDKVRQRIVPHHGTERHYHFDARLLEAGPNTYLEGFWQSPRYFEGCEEAIREEFTFKEPVPPRILELCRQLRDADSVCINVRRGDFVGNHFHGTMPVEYYTKALSFVTPQYRDPKVFVFSDDIEWCRQQFTLPFETTFMDHSFAGPKFSTLPGAHDRMQIVCDPEQFFRVVGSLAGRRQGQDRGGAEGVVSRTHQRHQGPDTAHVDPHLIRMSKPLITVGLAFRNVSPYLGLALRSLLCQSFPDWEAILIDDASTDDSLDVVRSLPDRRFKLICGKQQLGVHIRRNQAVAMASGRIFRHHGWR